MTEPAGAPPTTAAPETNDRSGYGALFGLLTVAVLFGTSELARTTLREMGNHVYSLAAFYHLFVRFDAPGALMVAGVVATSAIVGPWIPRVVVERPLRWVADNRILVAVLSGLGLAILAPSIYQDYPLALDEYAPVFQSKVFAAGKLYGEYPADLARRLVPAPGQFITVSREGKTIEANWPTYSALLVPFTKLGVDWLLNPIVGGLILLVLGYLTQQLLPDEPLAPAWAMLLCLASPTFNVNAISFYTMNLHLLVALTYSALFLDPTPRRLVAAGLVGAAGMSLNNPFPQMLYGTPWIVWMMLDRSRLRKLPWLALGYLPVIPLGWKWLALQAATHAPVQSPEAATQEAGGLLHGLQDELAKGAFQLPTERIWEDRLIWACKLWVWAVPGLVLFAAWGYRQLRRSPVARLQLWSALLMVVGYLFVEFNQGHGWGVRYLQPVWGILPLFAAAWLTRDPVGLRWNGFAACLVIGSLCLMTPQRLSQVREFIAEAMSQSPPADPPRRQIIFVNIRVDPQNTADDGTLRGRYYAWDAVRNDPFLRGPTIKLRSINPQADRDFMERRYPGAVERSLTVHGSVWDLP